MQTIGTNQTVRTIFCWENMNSCRFAGSHVPFSNTELASISKDIRNCALGLIDLAFNDCVSSPSTAGASDLDRARYKQLFDVVTGLF